MLLWERYERFLLFIWLKIGKGDLGILGILGGVNSRYRGFEVVVCLVYLWNSMEMSVVGRNWLKVRVIRDFF